MSIVLIPIHSRSLLARWVEGIREEIRVLRRRARYAGGRKARAAERRMRRIERWWPNIVALEDASRNPGSGDE